MAARTITLRQLRYLVALADTRHFRYAAEQAGISQPSLSSQIQILERAIDLPLVERGRAGAILTPEGREVVARARRVLEEVQGIADFAAVSRGGLVGTIRLGTKPTLGPYLLPRVVSRLHLESAELKLYVRESGPRELEDELHRGIHDVILTQLPVAGADFVVARLFREPLLVALAADDPLAAADEIDPADLAGAHVLSLSPRYHLHDRLAEICAELGATVVRDYEGTSLDALRSMVGMGMGLTFLPALYAESEIPARGEVVVRPLRGRAITRSVGLVWRRHAGAAEAYLAIARLVREVVRQSHPALTVES